MATGVPSATAQAQEKANTTFDSFTMKNTNLNEAPGVKLNDQQKLIVASVLDVSHDYIPTLPRCVPSTAANKTPTSYSRATPR